jgi:DNA end-binding protein Ku
MKTETPVSARSPASASNLATASRRASWSGFLRLGPLAAPVRAYSAIAEPAEPEIHQFHKNCGQRIRCPRMCPDHGPVSTDEIAKGHETETGKTVFLNQAALAAMRPAKSDEVVLDQFEFQSKLDPVRFAGQHYYLLPSARPAAATLQTIGESLERLERIGIGELTLHGKKRIVAVSCRSRRLTMHTLTFPQWVRAVPAHSAGAGEPVVATGQIDKVVRKRSARVVWSRFRDPGPDRTGPAEVAS